MKIEHIASYTLVVTAAWVILSFAHVFGTLLPYSASLIGLMTFNDIIVASTGYISLVCAIFGPIMFCYNILAAKLVGLRFTGRLPIIFVVFIPASLAFLLAYIFYVAGELQLPHILAKGLAPLSMLIIVMLGTYYDEIDKRMEGRVISTFVAMVILVAVGGGAHRGTLSEGRLNRCTSIFLENAEVAKGRLIISSRSGIFIAREQTSLVTFLPSESFDRVETGRCSEPASTRQVPPPSA